MNTEEETAPLFDATTLLKSVVGLWAYFLLSFFWRFALYVGFAAILAGVVYWMFRHDEDYRGEISAGGTFLVVGGIALTITVQTAFLSTIIKAIEKLGIGRVIFDFLLARVTSGKDVESFEDAESVSMSAHGMTEPQLCDATHDAAVNLINKTGIDSKMPLLVRRSTKKVFSIATWGVVKIILRYAGEQTRDGNKTLDMAKLRSEAGKRIDAELWGSARANVNKNAWTIMKIVGVITLAIAGVAKMVLSNAPG